MEASKYSELKKKHREYSLLKFKKTGIVLTEIEQNSMEIADFGLGNLDNYGVQLVILINNRDYCIKKVCLLPRQICPEHWHPPVDSSPGKRETFRCLNGIMYLYLEGEKTENPQAIIPSGDKANFTVWKEIVLLPGEQYTVPPNSLHWFQAGDDGVVFAEFTTPSTDENDIFTNPDVIRVGIHNESIVGE